MKLYRIITFTMLLIGMPAFGADKGSGLGFNQQESKRKTERSSEKSSPTSARRVLQLEYHPTIPNTHQEESSKEQGSAHEEDDAKAGDPGDKTKSGLPFADELAAERTGKMRAWASTVEHDHTEKWGPNFTHKVVHATERGFFMAISDTIAAIMSNILIKGAYAAYGTGQDVIKRFTQSPTEQYKEAREAHIQHRSAQLTRDLSNMGAEITMLQAELVLAQKAKEKEQLQQQVVALRAKQAEEMHKRQVEMHRIATQRPTAPVAPAA